MKITDATVEVRVGPAYHPSGPEAYTFERPASAGAKPGEIRHFSHPSALPPQQSTIRKRALRRAIHRAENSAQQGTWYRGRFMSIQQLRPGQQPSASRRAEHRPTPRQPRRLRVVTWNCGGLSGPRYHEVTTWLQDEHRAGRTVDVCFLQETRWKIEAEYTTDPAMAGDLT